MPGLSGLDITVRCVYGDETGGDFHDFIETSSDIGSIMAIVVGNGSGHGISAALLMASVRVALRARAAQTGGPAEVRY